MNPMERLFESAKSLPSIPKVLQELMASLNKDEVDVDEITKPMEQDPALAARVLRLANTAHFGAPRKVVSIDDAIVLVGLEAVRLLVISSGLMGSFKAIPGFDMQRFWRVSLLSGYIARDLAPKCKVDKELAYTAALMHGIGILAIHNVFPDAAKLIDSLCIDHNPQERIQHELSHLGLNHAEVSAELARSWKLPQGIVDIIKFYADPLNPVSPRGAGLVYVSTLLAMYLEDHIQSDEWLAGMPTGLIENLGLDWDGVLYRETMFENLRETADMVVS